MRTEDGCLVSKCLNGDSNAFGFLVDKYKSAVFTLAYSKLNNFHDAQDLTQEVFIEAYRDLHKLRRWDRFAFWLYRIALNKCKNAIRAMSRRLDKEFLEDQGPGLIADVSINSYHEEVVFELINEILESLDEIWRQVIMLHYFAGMTSSEISMFSGVSPSAVRKRLNKARRLLKVEILNAMGKTFRNKLPASFTFNTIDMVKHIRVKPLPKATGISLGVTVALGIAIFGSGLFTKLPETVVTYDNPAASGMATSASTNELPVVFVNMAPRTISKNSVFTAPQGGLDGDSLGQTEWVKYGNGFVLGTDPEAWDNKDIMDPTVIYDGNVYKMWYSGSDGENWRIGYATSADGINWQKYGGNPVIDLGKPGEWDDFYVVGPSVIFHKDSGIYEMWYCGSNWRYQNIGYATSTDGIKWEKYVGNPVLDVGASWEWDGQLICHPTVIFHDNLYRMWYDGYNAHWEIGYATSSNGIDWQKYSSNPVFRIGNTGTWDNNQIIAPVVIHDGSSYKMWYSGENGFYPKVDESRIFLRIGYATSPDGIVWKRCKSNPVLNIGRWDTSGLNSPYVIYDGETYKMWYAGSDGSHYRIGYATARVDNIDNSNVRLNNAPAASLKFEAFAPFPQPANPEVWIPYRISQPADVNITIYDIDGKVMRILNLGHQPTGQYISKGKAACWDGRNEAGEKVASGVYFYTIMAGDSFTTTKKLVVSK